MSKGHVFASYLVHGGAPEVIVKNIGEGGVRPQVPVVLDGTDVVEDEPAVAAVVVEGQAAEEHDGSQRVVPCHFHWVSGAIVSFVSRTPGKNTSADATC